ncbi:MAG TPA: alpha-amylase family glycosyl hydrolase [Catalimonadaceae bacterium]|nr:alpha-amylase family glycosyl hydrolase [Catalimonadaceae bacterium]
MRLHSCFTRQIFVLLSLVLSCSQPKTEPTFSDSTSSNLSRYLPKEYVELTHPEWTKNVTIYEVNVRQYTPEGTFKALETHLPRLKEMGVDIIWLMPVHPIGEKNRKGTLGSYYAVRDYYGINPEFGSLKDFKSLVDEIHSLGMHVILDWVANHSAWDNPLVAAHPEWYSKSRTGKFQSTPWRDYDDIIDFDYSQSGLREYMTRALKYWVKESDVDGFRCDVASFVPIEFWENARAELNAIKPVFMLAEAADRDLHKKAFDMTYAWTLWDHLHAITKNNKTIHGLTEGYIAEHVSIWPRNGFRMNFVDNHDKNSWEGNPFLNFGDGLKAAVVLTATMDGMPMMYSGQEAGLNRSLRFFDKDTIVWKKHEIGELYQKLFQLKHKNQGLWNGKWGGEMERIKSDKMDHVIAFSREKNGDEVIVVVNLGKEPVTVTMESESNKGTYREIFSGKETVLKGKDQMELEPWGYRVMERIKN